MQTDTVRIHNGERYWWRGDSFVRQLKGRPVKLLHREVYSDVYGNIPRGWHVHHKDRDQRNNEIENLVALAPNDHRREHRAELLEWTKTNRGLLLDNLARGRKKPRPVTVFICSVCEADYAARPSYGLRQNTCCSAACHNVAYRRRLKEAKHG